MRSAGSSIGHDARQCRPQALGKRDLLGGDEWPADLELNLSVREEWNPARVAGEGASVEERRDRPVRGTDLVAIERLPPDVEELTERVGAVDG
jgi:hypothetical protein